ncbi:MAG: chorismate mutase [Sulfurimonas sp.]|nr:chorismate mutase [Sulfurimonas sp.]MDQ7061812.1 chorismate mutase [Sulfurimonas sp.]
MKICKTLEEVRNEVDLVDEKIVELIAQRSHYIRQAASFKNSIDEVKAEDRIDYIMQRLRHKAIELEVSPNMITDLYKIMIDEMVETEIAELRNKDVF